MKNIASSLVIGFGVMAMATNVSAQVSMSQVPNYSFRLTAKECQNETFNAIINDYVGCIDVSNEFLIQKRANEIFGEMRDPTLEEQECVQKIIEKRMEQTDLNFWD